MSFDIFNPVGTAINNIDRSSRVTDILTNYNFHVLDVSFSMPAVLSLAAGFRFCTAPEVTLQHKEFKEGTFEYPRRVVSGAVVGDVSMHRGATFFNSDFYDWVSGAISGKPEMRRNLLVIQYSDLDTGISPGLSLGFVSFQSLTSLVQRVPARAWMLYDSLPTHYKSGTDFDAIGADISVSELTVSPLFFEEFNAGL